ncbi:uncharacterized protein Bfra_004124 [Botrytis fragariae]|uniref:Uncharacterized protein n=1 Tax=Botrytis fragariae TaxID=1964551 RepID=A0A8H6AUY1_9HELO|nr:uncharacterized protein Bfra_004124 [Botrytis fragariae]KAF5874117.1 hypothetical protein Bfra_004124 [Botrytis fragariae]
MYQIHISICQDPKSIELHKFAPEHNYTKTKSTSSNNKAVLQFPPLARPIKRIGEAERRCTSHRPFP